MRVLVTGAAGFVGRHVVADLYRAGHEVVGSGLEPWEEKYDPPFGWKVMDLTDRQAVGDCLEQVRPAGVIHLAALASPGGSWEDPQDTYRTNIEGAANLLEAVRRCPARVLLVGSAQQYARPPDGRPLIETDPQNPDSPYALSKIVQEQMGRMYLKRYGLPAVFARSFNHTGPGQSPLYAVGSFCSQIVRLEKSGGGRMQVGNLHSVRDLLDVRDVARAYTLLLERGQSGQAYNVCSGRSVRMGEVLDTLLDVAGLRDRVEVQSQDPPEEIPPDILVGDPTKVYQELGWRTRTPLDRSLVDTLDWYRENGYREDEE